MAGVYPGTVWLVVGALSEYSALRAGEAREPGSPVPVPVPVPARTLLQSRCWYNTRQAGDEVARSADHLWAWFARLEASLS